MDMTTYMITATFMLVCLSVFVQGIVLIVHGLRSREED